MEAASCMAITTKGRFDIEKVDEALEQMGASEILKRDEEIMSDESGRASSATETGPKRLLTKLFRGFSVASSDTSSADGLMMPKGYDTETARYLVGHSSAAYCKLHSIPLFECGCHSEKAPVNGFHYVVRGHDEKHDASGFAGFDEKRKAIVAAFRGTVSMTNWKANLIFLKQRDHHHHDEEPSAHVHSYPKDVRVHTGFYHTYRSIKDRIVSAVVQMKEDHPDYQVFVTGHSLGGAQATFCAADLAHKHRIDSVIAYTFGQPRVFDGGGRNFFHGLKGVTLYRVVNGLDPVPGLPGRAIGFRHVGHLIHFKSTSAKEVKSALKKNSKAEIEGFSQTTKARAGLHRFRIEDHLVYAERYGAQRILRGQDIPRDPWDPDRTYRHAVSATLSLFLDEFPNKAALVVVYAPWCSHCRKFLPIFRQLAKKYREDDRVQFLAIDGSTNDCPDGYVPHAFPCIFLKRKGQNAREGAERYEGSRELEALEAALTKVMDDEVQSPGKQN